MTTEKDRERKIAGKDFAPGVPEADDETEAITTHGGGKQFSPSVHDPDVDEEARQTEGSGKQFAKDVHDTDEPEEHHRKGSGTQWEPPHDD